MKKYDFIAVLLIVMYIVAFGFTCCVKYQTFSYHDLDLAVANQIMWNTLRGDIYYTSVQGGFFLKLHAPFIYILFLPLYALWSSPLTLLLAQTLFLALAGWPIYLIAKRELGNGSHTLVFLIVFLLYPPLGYITLLHPHGLNFSPFFLAWAFLLYRREKYGAYLAMLGLALSCREEISFMAVALGVFALWEGKRMKWWLVPLAAGVAWFALYFFLLGPYLREGAQSPFLIYYGEMGSSPQNFLKNIFTNPIYVLGVIFKPYKILYIFRMLAPLAFMPLLAPGILFICLPNFLLNLLGTRRDIADIFLQYNSPLIPFIFIAAITGFARFRRIARSGTLQKVAIRAILILGVLFSVRLGPQLHLFSKTWKPRISCLPQYDFRNAAKRRMVGMIPPGAAVTTHFGFFSHLSSRRELEALPWLLWGRIGFFPDSYLGRSDIEYALIDFSDSATFLRFYRPVESPERFRRFISENRLGLVTIYDQIALYRRGEPDSLPLYENLGRKANETAGRHRALFGGLELKDAGMEFNVLPLGKQLTFTSLWQARERLHEDFSMLIRIEDESGRQVLQQPRNICYHMYPTAEWPQGETIRARHFIALPPDLPPGRYRLKMTVINKYPPCKALHVTAPKNDIDEDGWLILGDYES
jgi:uncharacterized membrane protein